MINSFSTKPLPVLSCYSGESEGFYIGWPDGLDAEAAGILGHFLIDKVEDSTILSLFYLKQLSLENPLSSSSVHSDGLKPLSSDVKKVFNNDLAAACAVIYDRASNLGIGVHKVKQKILDLFEIMTGSSSSVIAGSEFSKEFLSCCNHYNHFYIYFLN